ADDGVHGKEVWRTDGTAPGTFLVKDVAPGVTTSNPLLLGSAGAWTYFQVTGGHVWRTDGTAQNTTQLSEGTSGIAPAGFKISAALGSALYFAAYHYIHRAGHHHPQRGEHPAHEDRRVEDLSPRLR